MPFEFVDSDYVEEIAFLVFCLYLPYVIYLLVDTCQKQKRQKDFLADILDEPYEQETTGARNTTGVKAVPAESQDCDAEGVAGRTRSARKRS